MDYGINDMYGNNKCGHRNMLIEENVIQNIKIELQVRKNIELSDMFNTYCEKTFVDNIDITKLLECKDNLTKEMRQLRKDRTDNVIDDEIYKEEMKELSKRTGDINAEISRHERRSDEIVRARLQFENYKKMIDEIDIDNLTNTILKKIFSKIYIKNKIVNGKKNIYLSFRYKF